MQKLYQEEIENYQNLWKVFSNNCLTSDFRRSLYSALAMVFIPTGVNVYYIFRVSVLKNIMRLTSIFTTIAIFHYNMNRDFEEFIKKDTKDSNQARVYIQRISTTNVIFPYFKEETLKVIDSRKQ